jgi:hypothetical protein
VPDQSVIINGRDISTNRSTSGAVSSTWQGSAGEGAAALTRQRW